MSEIKAELVWTFKGGNYGGMEGYAEATMEKSDDRDTPYYIIPVAGVPNTREQMERIMEKVGSRYHSDPVGFACHVLAAMGLREVKG